jgi:hypothetical protein
MYRVSLKFCIAGQSNIVAHNVVHCDVQGFIFLKDVVDECRAGMTCVGDLLLEMCNTAISSVCISFPLGDAGDINQFGWVQGLWVYGPTVLYQVPRELDV